MSALVIFPYIARALSVVQCAGIPTNLTVHYLAEARIGDAATDQGAPLYELRVGSPTPPHSGQTADFKWVSGREEVFVVTYDPALYRVSLTVGGTTVVYESPPPAPSVGDIVLLLTAVKPQSSVRVHSLFLNGQALGVEAKAWGPGNGHAGLHIRGDGWSRVTLVGVIQMTFASGHPNAPRNSQLAVELALAMNSETQPGPPDADGDGVADGVDNCPDVANSDQADLDQDGHGDACDEDIDGDGMPNDWEQANGLDERDPADASLDSDGDGLSNLAEYMAGTNPNDPNSALWARIVVRSPPQISWDSVAGRSYSIWRATTLKHGMAGFEKIASGIAATPPVNTFVDYTATGLTHYYRIQLESR